MGTGLDILPRVPGLPAIFFLLARSCLNFPVSNKLSNVAATQPGPVVFLPWSTLSPRC